MIHPMWAPRVLWFPFYAGAEIVKTSLQVMWDIVTPGSSATPAFVEVPVRCRTDFEFTLLANLISLTPGTVTVAVRRDPATLWVHGLYVQDRASFQQDIHAMEDRVLAVTRPSGPPESVPAEGERN
ncbi:MULTISPECIES: Na+/H+ antiporter subunit E [unclassified Nocardiopsis]|jgi:multicomponent Na+:H+ antiporter subunit E|uniref:Na+/H+ antiporter subunit E n=1 Tax=unclassified Nocardiopsis TaxID=2649073 RepID=UPI00066E61B3|nr:MULTISPECIES: Na+/H+ antiporter subunit E [unclassified Nocardiopsis]MBQ1079996.1 Na+/H+ antiporter subunit E [Nocardiopsis sp. B62]